MITPEHEAFARAVVALAREHGMNNIRATFNDRSSKNFRKHTHWHDDVTMTWLEERHGSAGNISLETRAVGSITEAVGATVS